MTGIATQNIGKTMQSKTMSAGQPRPKSGAERMRRYRQRKRQGVVCVAPVPIYRLDIALLVAHQRLKMEDRADPRKVAEAVEHLIDDWARGKLVTRNRPDKT